MFIISIFEVFLSFCQLCFNTHVDIEDPRAGLMHSNHARSPAMPPVHQNRAHNHTTEPSTALWGLLLAGHSQPSNSGEPKSMPTVEGYLTSFDGYALSGHELQLEGAFYKTT